MSLRNDILTALTSAIASALPSAVVDRNGVVLDRLGSGGRVCVRDGDPGEPEVILSPPAYSFRHRAVVEAVVTGPTDAARETALEALLAGISGALAEDRTLGGLADYALAGAPQTEAVPVDGAAPLLGATVTVDLYYTSADPLA